MADHPDPIFRHDSNPRFVQRSDLVTVMLNAMDGPMAKMLAAPQPIADEEYAVFLLVDGETVQPMECKPGLSGLRHAAAGIVQGHWGQPEYLWRIQCQGFIFMSDHSFRVRDCFDELAEAARRYCDGQGIAYPEWADEDGRHADAFDAEADYADQVRRDYRAGVGRI